MRLFMYCYFEFFSNITTASIAQLMDTDTCAEFRNFANLTSVRAIETIDWRSISLSALAGLFIQFVLYFVYARPRLERIMAGICFFRLPGTQTLIGPGNLSA